MTECFFTPKKDTTSATICANCGLEKMLHTIGEGMKINKVIIITDSQIKEQKYCVAAEDRKTKIRQSITDASSYQTALLKKGAFSKNPSWKKMYRYFHVAKYPYKPHTNS